MDQNNIALSLLQPECNALTWSDWQKVKKYWKIWRAQPGQFLKEAFMRNFMKVMIDGQIWRAQPEQLPKETAIFIMIMIKSQWLDLHEYLRWNDGKHLESWIEKKPVKIVDVCCKVEQEENEGNHNYLEIMIMIT